MILLNTVNNKKFEIFENNWYFLMSILSYDTLNNYTKYIDIDSIRIIPIQSLQLKIYITKLINSQNFKIYELWNGNKTEALINPTKEMLDTLNIKIQPITEKRIKFLQSLVLFLDKNTSLNVIHSKKRTQVVIL